MIEVAGKKKPPSNEWREAIPKTDFYLPLKLGSTYTIVTHDPD